MPQRDGMGREEGGGLRMRTTCVPVVDTFWYLAKLIQLCKFKNKIKLNLKKIKHNAIEKKNKRTFMMFICVTIAAIHTC